MGSPLKGHSAMRLVCGRFLSGGARRRLVVLLIAVVMGLLLLAATSCGNPPPEEEEHTVLGPPQLVTSNAAGETGNGFSSYASISTDGRYVAFESQATNLVPATVVAKNNVFRKYLETGEVKLCSSSATGEPGNADSTSDMISGDGRYVVFSSLANNLVPGDGNGVSDVFRKDLETGEVVRCSTTSDGKEINVNSAQASMSADGRYIAFGVYPASGLEELEIGAGKGEFAKVYRKDLATGSLVLCSVSQSGEAANLWSMDAEISSDGRYVAFGSGADNLLPKQGGVNIQQFRGESELYWNIFRKDLETGEVLLCTASAAGEPVATISRCGSISSDGRYVLFDSYAENLVLGDTNQRQDLFRKDLVTGEVILCSTSSDAIIGDGNSRLGRMSADGRYVVFSSTATNFASVEVVEGTNWERVFWKDLESGEIALCAAADEGLGRNFLFPTISSAGRFVAFDAGGREVDDSKSYIYSREVTFD